MPIVLIPRLLLVSCWCDACSISAIGGSYCKSQLGKCFQIPTHLRNMNVKRVGGLNFHDNEK